MIITSNHPDKEACDEFIRNAFDLEDFESLSPLRLLGDKPQITYVSGGGNSCGIENEDYSIPLRALGNDNSGYDVYENHKPIVKVQNKDEAMRVMNSLI